MQSHSLRTSTVTIGMPVYNCEDTVAESIASIINQTFKDWELVVYDDGSRDGTVAVARKFSDPRIRVVEGGRNRGLPACLNKIIADCKSEFFARMDGDDIAYPDRLQKQFDYLETHAAVDLVGGSMLVFHSSGDAVGVRRAPETHDQICSHPRTGISMAHPTWMGKSEWFRRNPYDADMVRMEDWELLFRTREYSKFANLPDILLGYREDALSLRKQLIARRYKCYIILRSSWKAGQPWLAVMGLVGQVVRIAVETAAIGFNLNHCLLKHRVPPVFSDEAFVWKGVLDRTLQAANTVCNLR